MEEVIGFRSFRTNSCLVLLSEEATCKTENGPADATLRTSMASQWSLTKRSRRITSFWARRWRRLNTRITGWWVIRNRLSSSRPTEAYVRRCPDRESCCRAAEVTRREGKLAIRITLWLSLSAPTLPSAQPRSWRELQERDGASYVRGKP